MHRPPDPGRLVAADGGQAVSYATQPVGLPSSFSAITTTAAAVAHGASGPPPAVAIAPFYSPGRSFSQVPPLGQPQPLDSLPAGFEWKGGVVMRSLGSHLILELLDCPPQVLDCPQTVARVMTEAVHASGATLIEPFFHQFAPQGVSGVIIISESHFTIHTWPEYGYGAVDIFTCGEVIDMDAACEHLRQGLKAGRIQKMMLSRGLLDLPPEMIRHKPGAAEAPSAGNLF